MLVRPIDIYRVLANRNSSSLSMLPVQWGFPIEAVFLLSRSATYTGFVLLSSRLLLEDHTILSC